MATGPLTNIARAVQRVPGILGGLVGIAWMGGSATSGNTTAAAEFNCWVDPEAAEIVLLARHPRFTMVGLNVTHTVLLTTLAGAPVHDPLAVLRVTHPNLLAGVRRPVQVITTDGAARGMTLVDQRPPRYLTQPTPRSSSGPTPISFATSYSRR